MKILPFLSLIILILFVSCKKCDCEKDCTENNRLSEITLDNTLDINQLYYLSTKSKEQDIKREIDSLKKIINPITYAPSYDTIKERIKLLEKEQISIKDRIGWYSHNAPPCPTPQQACCPVFISFHKNIEIKKFNILDSDNKILKTINGSDIIEGRLMNYIDVHSHSDGNYNHKHPHDKLSGSTSHCPVKYDIGFVSLNGVKKGFVVRFGN